MLEHYFTLGTGGSAPRNFRSILSYLEHQVQKKNYIASLTSFHHHHHHHHHHPSSSSFRSCTFPYSTNFSLFNIFATRVQCAAVDRCHSVAESRVSCFQSSEIDLRWARYTWHRLAKVDSSSNRAGTLNMAVSMPEVRARPWVGVCVPLSLSLA